MAWFGTFAQRFELKIDHTKIDSDLSNFSLLIHFRQGAGYEQKDNTFIFENLADEFTKIRFTEDDGTTELYCEIVSWDATNLKGVIRALVPLISSVSDTILYLYFDQNQPTNATYNTYHGDLRDGTPGTQIIGDTKLAYTGTNIFNAWHMHNTPFPGSGLLNNATVSYQGIFNNMDTTNVIDGPDAFRGLSWNGSDEYVHFTQATTGVTDFSYSCYLNPSEDVNMRFIGKHNFAPNYGSYIGRDTLNRIEILVSWDGSNYYGLWSAADATLPGAWQHVVWTYDGATVRLYLDGEEHTGGDFPFSYALGIHDVAAQEYRIASVEAFDAKFKGDMCGIWVSNVAQSAAYVKAEYNALIDNLVSLEKTEFLSEPQTGQILYRFVLTGEQDSLEDITIPISNFQHRQQKNQRSYVSVIVPGIDYYDEISDRSNGKIMVYEDTYIIGILANSILICSADIDDIRTDEGAKSKSISVSGYGALSQVYAEYSLSGHNYRSLTQGKLTFRFPKPQARVRPGDSVTITTNGLDETIEIGNVSVFVSATGPGSVNSSMSITESDT